MAKKAKSTRRVASNQPGDTANQPSASEQAEGVTMSSANPKAVSRAEFRTLEQKVDQLCIKVGI